MKALFWVQGHFVSFLEAQQVEEGQNPCHRLGENVAREESVKREMRREEERRRRRRKGQEEGEEGGGGGGGGRRRGRKEGGGGGRREEEGGGGRREEGRRRKAEGQREDIRLMNSYTCTRCQH